ncbi:proliferation marker protein Ki-67 isoform X2 [Ambystoma mexicanum]|uniref:proliferation marker protein Ki-67 isoform X2 n=1 Tax=Ambystoma mexicanum TaxID=8296 RepID=UPI0037E901EC
MPLYGKIVVIKRSGSDGTHFPLTASSCLFGRKTECDIRIQLPHVSKEHCKIEVNENKEAIVTNLSTVNPTQLNGICIQQPVTLMHGDILTVIDRSFRFEYPLESTPKKKRHSTALNETLQQVAEIEPLRTRRQRSSGPIADDAESVEKLDSKGPEHTERGSSKRSAIKTTSRRSKSKESDQSPFSELYEMLKHRIDIKPKQLDDEGKNCSGREDETQENNQLQENTISQTPSSRRRSTRQTQNNSTAEMELYSQTENDSFGNVLLSEVRVSARSPLRSGMSKERFESHEYTSFDITPKLEKRVLHRGRMSSPNSKVLEFTEMSHKTKIDQASDSCKVGPTEMVTSEVSELIHTPARSLISSINEMSIGQFDEIASSVQNGESNKKESKRLSQSRSLSAQEVILQVQEELYSNLNKSTRQSEVALDASEEQSLFVQSALKSPLSKDGTGADRMSSGRLRGRPSLRQTPKSSKRVPDSSSQERYPGRSVSLGHESEKETLQSPSNMRVDLKSPHIKKGRSSIGEIKSVSISSTRRSTSFDASLHSESESLSLSFGVSKAMSVKRRGRPSDPSKSHSLSHSFSQGSDFGEVGVLEKSIETLSADNLASLKRRGRPSLSRSSSSTKPRSLSLGKEFEYHLLQQSKMPDTLEIEKSSLERRGRQSIIQPTEISVSTNRGTSRRGASLGKGFQNATKLEKSSPGVGQSMEQTPKPVYNSARKSQSPKSKSPFRLPKTDLLEMSTPLQKTNLSPEQKVISTSQRGRRSVHLSVKSENSLLVPTPETSSTANRLRTNRRSISFSPHSPNAVSQTAPNCNLETEKSAKGGRLSSTPTPIYNLESPEKSSIGRPKRTLKSPISPARSASETCTEQSIPVQTFEQKSFSTRRATLSSGELSSLKSPGTSPHSRHSTAIIGTPEQTPPSSLRRGKQSLGRVASVSPHRESFPMSSSGISKLKSAQMTEQSSPALHSTEENVSPRRKGRPSLSTMITASPHINTPEIELETEKKATSSRRGRPSKRSTPKSSSVSPHQRDFANVSISENFLVHSTPLQSQLQKSLDDIFSTGIGGKGAVKLSRSTSSPSARSPDSVQSTLVTPEKLMSTGTRSGRLTMDSMLKSSPVSPLECSSRSVHVRRESGKVHATEKTTSSGLNRSLHTLQSVPVETSETQASVSEQKTSPARRGRPRSGKNSPCDINSPKGRSFRKKDENISLSHCTPLQQSETPTVTRRGRPSIGQTGLSVSPISKTQTLAEQSTPGNALATPEKYQNVPVARRGRPSMHKVQRSSSGSSLVESSSRGKSLSGGSEFDLSVKTSDTPEYPERTFRSKSLTIVETAKPTSVSPNRKTSPLRHSTPEKLLENPLSVTSVTRSRSGMSAMLKSSVSPLSGVSTPFKQMSPATQRCRSSAAGQVVTESGANIVATLKEQIMEDSSSVKSPRLSGKVAAKIDETKKSPKKRRSGELDSLTEPPLKRKRVSFGGHLSPELFDKRLPPNSPLRRGATPARLSLPFSTPRALIRKSFGIRHAVIKERSDKHSPPTSPSRSSKKSPSPFRGTPATSPAKRSPAVSPSKRSSPAVSPAARSPSKRSSPAVSPAARSPSKRSSPAVSPAARSPSKRSSPAVSPAARSPSKRSSPAVSPAARSPSKRSSPAVSPAARSPSKRSSPAVSPAARSPAKRSSPAVSPAARSPAKRSSPAVSPAARSPAKRSSPAVSPAARSPAKRSSPAVSPAARSPAKRSSPAVSPAARSPAKRSSPAVSPAARSPAKRSSPAVSPAARSPAKRSSPAVSPAARSPAKRSSPAVSPAAVQSRVVRSSSKNTSPLPVSRTPYKASQSPADETLSKLSSVSCLPGTPSKRRVGRPSSAKVKLPPVSSPDILGFKTSSPKTPIRRGRFSISQIKSPVETTSESTSKNPRKSIDGKRTPSRRKSRIGALDVIRSKRKSGATEANLLVAKTWADIVKLGVAKPQKTIKNRMRLKVVKKKLTKTKTPVRKLHENVGTGHADSPATIVIGKAHSRIVNLGHTPRVVKHFSMMQRRDVNESFTGMMEMFKTPTKEQQRKSLRASRVSTSTANEASIVRTPEESGEMIVSPLSSTPGTRTSKTYSKEALSRYLTGHVSPSSNKLQRVSAGNDEISEKVKTYKQAKIVKNKSKCKTAKSKVDDSLVGLKRLLKTPKEKSKCVIDAVALKQLMKTPRQSRRSVLQKLDVKPKKTSDEDLDGFLVDIKRLMKSPKQKGQEVLDMVGVSRIMKTPKQKAKPVQSKLGIRRLMRTPDEYIRITRKTPRQKGQPVEDLVGISRILKTPKMKNQPVDDMIGIKRLMASPKHKSAPLKDFKGIKRLLRTPQKQNTLLKQSSKRKRGDSNAELNYSGLKELFNTPEECKDKDKHAKNLPESDGTTKQILPGSTDENECPQLEIVHSEEHRQSLISKRKNKGLQGTLKVDLTETGRLTRLRNSHTGTPILNVGTKGKAASQIKLDEKSASNKVESPRKRGRHPRISVEADSSTIGGSSVSQNEELAQLLEAFDKAAKTSRTKNKTEKLKESIRTSKRGPRVLTLVAGTKATKSSRNLRTGHVPVTSELVKVTAPVRPQRKLTQGLKGKDTETSTEDASALLVLPIALLSKVTKKAELKRSGKGRLPIGVAKSISMVDTVDEDPLKYKSSTKDISKDKMVDVPTKLCNKNSVQVTSVSGKDLGAGNQEDAVIVKVQEFKRSTRGRNGTLPLDHTAAKETLPMLRGRRRNQIESVGQVMPSLNASISESSGENQVSTISNVSTKKKKSVKWHPLVMDIKISDSEIALDTKMSPISEPFKDKLILEEQLTVQAKKSVSSAGVGNLTSEEFVPKRLRRMIKSSLTSVLSESVPEKTSIEKVTIEVSKSAASPRRPRNKLGLSFSPVQEAVGISPREVSKAEVRTEKTGEKASRRKAVRGNRNAQVNQMSPSKVSVVAIDSDANLSVHSTSNENISAADKSNNLQSCHSVTAVSRRGKKKTMEIQQSDVFEPRKKAETLNVMAVVATELLDDKTQTAEIVNTVEKCPNRRTTSRSGRAKHILKPTSPTSVLKGVLVAQPVAVQEVLKSVGVSPKKGRRKKLQSTPSDFNPLPQEQSYSEVSNVEVVSQLALSEEGVAKKYPSRRKNVRVNKVKPVDQISNGAISLNATETLDSKLAVDEQSADHQTIAVCEKSDVQDHTAASSRRGRKKLTKHSAMSTSEVTVHPLNKLSEQEVMTPNTETYIIQSVGLKSKRKAVARKQLNDPPLQILMKPSNTSLNDLDCTLQSVREQKKSLRDGQRVVDTAVIPPRVGRRGQSADLSIKSEVKEAPTEDLRRGAKRKLTSKEVADLLVVESVAEPNKQLDTSLKVASRRGKALKTRVDAKDNEGDVHGNFEENIDQANLSPQKVVNSKKMGRGKARKLEPEIQSSSPVKDISTKEKAKVGKGPLPASILTESETLPKRAKMELNDGRIPKSRGGFGKSERMQKTKGTTLVNITPKRTRARTKR